MFVLIQRGQSFVDANNYPVEICKVTLTQVIYRRQNQSHFNWCI
ncbi:DUF4222 domain-containing protein [Escherichia coli]